MKNKSITGALIVIASIILLSALRICSALSDLAAATMGFMGTSEPTTLTVFLYVLSGVLLVGGLALIIWDLFTKVKSTA